MYNMKNGILFVFFFSGPFVSGATLDNFLELVGKKQALLGKSQLTKNVEAKGKENEYRRVDQNQRPQPIGGCVWRVHGLSAGEGRSWPST